jgi:hypothetical protein
MSNVKCWNCGNDFEHVSSERKTEHKGQSIDTSPPWWDGNIAIPFSTNEWEYVLNGLSALIDNAYLWGWADTEVETDIRNIIDRIEKNIGVE